jgi:hypothetical protein
VAKCGQEVEMRREREREKDVMYTQAVCLMGSSMLWALPLFITAIAGQFLLPTRDIMLG